MPERVGRANASGEVQSVRRATDLLEKLAVAPVEGERLSRLADLTGLDRSTTRRILATLVGSGLVDQDPGTRRYHLGLAFFTLAAAASNRYDLQQVASAEIAKISERTGDAAIFALRSGNDVVCMHVTSGSYPVQVMPMDIGSRRPVGAGAIGASVLMGLPDKEVDQILAAVADRLAVLPGQTPERARELIAGANRTGIFEDDEAGEVHARAMAMPLIHRLGRPIGCVAVFATPERLTGSHNAEVVAALADATREIIGLMHKMQDATRHRTTWAGNAEPSL